MNKIKKIVLVFLSFTLLIPLIIVNNILKGKYELSHYLILISLLMSLILNAMLLKGGLK